MTDARSIGNALFLIAEEDGVTERIAEDVGTVRAVLSESPQYVKLLDTPALSKDERIALIDNAFSSVDERLLNLLKILAEQRGVYLFAKVFDTYEELYDSARGIERVEAITAVALTEAQLTALTKKLNAMTGKTAVIKNTVDPTILGGVKLRYQGKQLDGSVKTRLDKFEAALKSTVI